MKLLMVSVTGFGGRIVGPIGKYPPKAAGRSANRSNRGHRRTPRLIAAVPPDPSAVTVI